MNAPRTPAALATPAPTPMPPKTIEMRGIGKGFGGVTVLRGIDFDLKPGEVHALFGANGAGKSTLARVLTGQLQPDAGEILMRGVPQAFTAPRVALRAGIAMVAQETSLAADLSIAENIVLPLYGMPGSSALRNRRALATAALQQLGAADEFELDAPVATLSAARRQMVEIAKALVLDAQVIVFDEPTTSLSPAEVTRLFKVMNALRDAGRAMVFVSHRLEELFSITDRMTVLRDGLVVAEGVPTASLSQTELIRLMVGRDVATLQRRAPGSPRPTGVPVLEVRGLAAPPVVNDVSFTLHEGEILGLGGLVGAGRSEVVEALYGLRPMTAGTVALAGRPYRPRRPVDAMRAGFGFVAEDRRRQSIVPDFSVRENLLLAHVGHSRSPLLRHEALAPRIDQLCSLLDLPPHRLNDDSLLRFSGGMQQKILIMRWLLLKPRVLILDEPTKGVDIGARAAIYTLLRQIAAEGVAILLISSDFEELLALSDRIVPISDGRSIGNVDAQALDEAKLLLLAAPRSSLAAQRALLDDAASAFGAVAFWAVIDDRDLICLAASGEVPATRAALGFSAGSVERIAACAIPAALTERGEHIATEADGRRSLLCGVSNAIGHDLGCIGLSWPAGTAPPPGALVRERLAALATRHLDSAFRIGLPARAPHRPHDPLQQTSA